MTGTLNGDPATEHDGTGPERPAGRRGGRMNNRLKNRYGEWAVVLGSSEGIGLAFASELARRRLNVLLAARRPAELERAAASIRERFGTHADILILDLAEPNPWPVIEKAMNGRDWGLVVYNAAASPIGAFLDLNLEAVRRTVAVNVASPLDVVHGAGNRFRARFRNTGRRGGIILMSSLSGLRGTPIVSAYAATKAWNLVLAEGVSVEARPEGVDVMACVAGATDTPGYRDSLTGRGPGAPVQAPEAVAREALDRLGRRGSAIPGVANRIIAALAYGLLPRRWGSGLLGRATASLRRRTDAGLDRVQRPDSTPG